MKLYIGKDGLGYLDAACTELVLSRASQAELPWNQPAIAAAKAVYVRGSDGKLTPLKPAPRAAPNKTTARPSARPNTPARRGKQTMSKASQAKAERDALVANYSASELKAANEIMRLWAQQAEQGVLPRGFDTSIAHAIRIARKQPGVTPKQATGGVMVGSRFYVGGRPPEDGAQ